MQPRVTPLKTDRKEWTSQQLLEQWRQYQGVTPVR